MASKGTFINPQSRTLSTKPVHSLDKNRIADSTFIGEVIDVVYTGKRAGCVVFRGGTNNAGTSLDEIESIAQPLLANIKAYPIKGELVLIFYYGATYYLPLNLLNNPIVNRVPTTKFSKSTSEQKTDSSKLIPTIFNLSEKEIYVTPSLEGDVVLEGRFGHSLKFGSTLKYQDKAVTEYSKSDISENGDPIVILRNGSKSTVENILVDDASIYMCSTQRIVIDNNQNGFEAITAPWSTINVNSSEYSVEEDLASTNEYEDESGQFGGAPGTGGAPGSGGAGSPPTSTPTPPTAEVKDLEKLPEKYMSYAGGSPIKLEELYIVDGSPITGTVADPYLKLKKAGAAAGVLITLNSGFRANEDIIMPNGTKKKGQKTLYAEYQANGQPVTARPGYSNHQLGTAVDINVSNPNTYKWLVRNAIKYGFIRGVASERWHWEYKQNASTIYAKVAKGHPTWDGYDDGMA